MFKIFITKSIYDRINGDNNKKKPLLYRILKWRKDDHIKTLSDAATEDYKSHPEKMLEHPSSLFVLNITKAEAADFRKDYGVMCVSGENPDVSLLLDINDTFKPDPDKIKFNGWDAVLDSVEPLPSNALLLADRYLFSYDSMKYDSDATNIYRILDELLPIEFKGSEYHVTIAFCVTKIDRKLTFEEIDNQLNDTIEQLKQPHGNKPSRNYDIMLEVLGYTDDCSIYRETHHRRIVSNYFYVQVEQQLTAFKSDQTGIIKQNIIPWALFTKSGLAGRSSLPLETVDDAVTLFKQFNKEYTKKTVRDIRPFFSYSVNGERPKTFFSGLQNRLFK